MKTKWRIQILVVFVVALCMLLTTMSCKEVLDKMQAIPPQASIPEFRDNSEKTIVFCDSYGLWAVKFEAWLPHEIHYSGAITHVELLDMIEKQRSDTYKQVVIIGGIGDLIIREGYEVSDFVAIRVEILTMAAIKFPGAEIIMVSLEDMLYAWEHFPIGTDPWHISKDGYFWLWTQYPEVTGLWCHETDSCQDYLGLPCKGQHIVEIE